MIKHYFKKGCNTLSRTFPLSLCYAALGRLYVSHFVSVSESEAYEWVLSDRMLVNNKERLNRASAAIALANPDLALELRRFGHRWWMSYCRGSSAAAPVLIIVSWSFYWKVTSQMISCPGLGTGVTVLVWVSMPKNIWTVSCLCLSKLTLAVVPLCVPEIGFGQTIQIKNFVQKYQYFNIPFKFNCLLWQ